MELVNEWFPTGKFKNVDTPFWTEPSYEKELLADLPLTRYSLKKEEIEYHGKFGHTLRRIQHIALMSRIDLCYETCRLANQNVAPSLPGFQGIKRCVQYMASHPHKTICYPSNSYDGSNVIRLTWSGNQVEDHTTQIILECHQDADHARILNRRRSILGIINTLLGVAVCWKVQIHPSIASDSTDGEIRCMYKAIKKTKVIKRYTEALSLYTGTPAVIGRITQVVSLLLKLKELLLELKILIFPSFFYKKVLTMVSFFQNMKSPVSCRKICA